MICPQALARTAPAAAAEGEQVQASGRWTELLEWLRGDDALPQFTRFVLVGGTSSLFYAVLFWTLEGLGSQPANVIAVVLSSILANDLHRRLTFHAEERLSWATAQWEGGSISLIGLVATTFALGVLDQTSADASLFVQLALVSTVFATIGMLRFVALRWLFVQRGA